MTHDGNALGSARSWRLNNALQAARGSGNYDTLDARARGSRIHEEALYPMTVVCCGEA